MLPATELVGSCGVTIRRSMTILGSPCFSCCKCYSQPLYEYPSHTSVIIPSNSIALHHTNVALDTEMRSYLASSLSRQFVHCYGKSSSFVVYTFRLVIGKSHFKKTNNQQQHLYWYLFTFIHHTSLLPNCYRHSVYFTNEKIFKKPFAIYNEKRAETNLHV